MNSNETKAKGFSLKSIGSSLKKAFSESHTEDEQGWGIENSLHKEKKEKMSLGQKYVDLLIRTSGPQPQDFGKYLFDSDSRFHDILTDVHKHGTAEQLKVAQNQLSQYLVKCVDELMKDDRVIDLDESVEENKGETFLIDRLKKHVFDRYGIANATEEPFSGLQEAVVSRVSLELKRAVGIKYEYLCKNDKKTARDYPDQIDAIVAFKKAKLKEYLEEGTECTFTARM